MSNKTSNYGLTKPLPEEFYDINVQNENMDIIDEALVNRSQPMSMGGHKITDVAEPESGSDVATRHFVEQHSIAGNTYVATDYDKDGNVTIKPYVADEDELTFKSHISNKDNPHNVTLSQLGAIGYKKTLTSDDNLNNITEEGIYRYLTSSIPENCPYSNAGIVEVIKAGNNTSGIIQRVTRYGSVGYTKQRILGSDGSWTSWMIVPLMFKKTTTQSTNENGNANTTLDKDDYIILSISVKDSSGGETYICHPYKTDAAGGNWYVNICNVTAKENVAKKSFTLTIYYTVAT